MKNTRWGLALGAIAVLATSNASAAPSQNDDTGRYVDDLSDGVGLANGSTNAELSGSGWIALESAGSPGIFTTKDIIPSALSAWGKVYVKGSGALSIRVLSSSGSLLATPTMVASDDAGFSRMADISSLSASNGVIKIEVTFAANGPSEPIVDALAVTWTPVSTLKLAANNPASLCSGQTGLWKFPFSVSNVTSKATVVTVPLGTGSLTPVFPDQNTRLQFISATHGGLYHAGPGSIVVDGVTILPNTVYWRLGDVRFGTTFPLGLTAVIPNGTLGGTTYQLTATGYANNAATVAATTTLTTATATPALVIEKTLTNAYRIGDQWRAKSGSNIGYTITVRNSFASQCRATAERIVVWDALTIPSAPYSGGPTNLVGLTYSPGGASLHGSDAAGNLVSVPANAVFAQIPSLAPGASATFSFSMPLSGALPYDHHVVNVASLDSGYAPHAGLKTDDADFYIGIDYAPHGSFAKGDSIRGAPQVSSFEDNNGLTVGYGEYFKFLLHAHNEGASVLNTTTLFDKLPLGQVELVDVYVPASANATVRYHAGGDTNATNDPPDYNPATGVLGGGWTTNPAGAKWVAIAIPRIGSSVIPDNNAGAPTGVTAEIGVRTLPPTAACDETPIENWGYFHTAFYEPESGVPTATNLSAHNVEHVTIVPKVPSFETSYAVSNPGIALASGDIRYTISLTNRVPGAASETDSAQNIVVRVNLPKVEVAGILSHLDLTSVVSSGGSVDYTGLPAYFDITYTSIAANSTRSIDVDVFAPKGIANGAIAKLTAQITYQDFQDVCDVDANTVTASTTFDVTPFVQVDKRLDFAVAGLGRPVQYTLRSINSGEGAAIDTVVFDRLPSELQFVRAPVPANGQRIYFSNATAPQMPVSVRDDGNFSESFVLSGGLFQAGVVSGGYVTSPVPNPTWIAVLVDNPALTPPQLPANGEPYEVVLEMLVPNTANLIDRVVVNEANIAAAGLLPAVSNRPLLLISDNPALAITGGCPGAIAAGENLHLAYTFTNNSTNPDDGVTARIAIPTAGLTPVNVRLTTPNGTSSPIALPGGDVFWRVSSSIDGTQTIITWDVTGYLGGALESGQSVTMDLEVEALGLATGDQIPVNVSGTATRDLPGAATVNVGAQCTLIVSNPNVKITKLVDLESAVQGDTLTYTLVVENNGPHDAANVIISEILPAHMTFVPNSVRVSPSGWRIQGNNAPAVVGASLQWSSDEGNALVGPTDQPGFLPGNSPNIYISFRVAVGAAPAGTTLTNCATLDLGPEASGDQIYDEDTDDNDSCVPVRVPNPDPRITKTGPTTVLPDQSFGYQLTWSNASRQPAANVVFFEKIPNIDGDGTPDMTVTGVVVPNGVSVYYAATSAPGNDPGTHPGFDPQAPVNADWKASAAELTGPPTWIAFVVGSLPGNSAPASATVNVVAADPTTGPSAAGTLFTNCALIELRGETDEDAGNNQSCIETRVPGLNVALTKTCDPEGFFPGARPGDPTNFVLQIGNLGTTPAYGIRVTDPMPSWFLLGGFTPAVATLEAGGSFIDDSGDPIAGGVAWTQVGNTWVLGTNNPTDERYFRKVALPSGARVNLTLIGSVNYDVAAETLVTNNANVETLRETDNDDPEEANVLFDNADGCSLTVHRPDPVVQKTADVSFAGAGDAINYTIGYDNLGLAAANQVIIEDLFPEGVDYVIGSLTDVPADATVSYYDGTTWTTTAPVGADGTTAPGVKGIRVAFAAFEAPLAGGFRQNGLVSFERGTFVGTAWDAAKGAVTVAPGYAGTNPTYTSPRIPTNNSGSILEWVSLIAAGSGAEIPVIEVLDGETDAVLMTADTLSEDLRTIDPSVHPTLKLRAKYAPLLVPDYTGELQQLPALGSLSRGGQALVTSGDLVAGLSDNGSGANVVALWEQVGNTFQSVELPADVTTTGILYLDANHLVVRSNTNTLSVFDRTSGGDWVQTVLGQAPSAQASPLQGVNEGLCSDGGPARDCIFVAWQDSSNNTMKVSYDGPEGWVTTTVDMTYRQVSQLNPLGYAAVGSVGTGGGAGWYIIQPNGTGWEAPVVPAPTNPTIGQAMLALDAGEFYYRGSTNNTHVIYRVRPTADPMVWQSQSLGSGSIGNFAGRAPGMVYGSFGYLRFWRTGDAFVEMSPLQQPPGAGSRDVSAIGDGVLGGYVTPTPDFYPNYPQFWATSGTVFVPSEVPAITERNPGRVDKIDVSGTLAWGTDELDYDRMQGFVRAGEDAPYVWNAYPLTRSEFPNAYGTISAVGPLGWVGESRTSTNLMRPAVWLMDDLSPTEATMPTVLPTSSDIVGEVLGATPDGCMIGEVSTDAGTRTVQWIKGENDEYQVVYFDEVDTYSNIAFVSSTPRRLFGGADVGEDNNVSVEFVCDGANGFQLVELPRSDLDVGEAVDGLLKATMPGDWSAIDVGWWVVDGESPVRLLEMPEDQTYFHCIDVDRHGSIVFGYDSCYATSFASYVIDDETLGYQQLPSFQATVGEVIVSDYESGRLLGRESGDTQRLNIWRQATPESEWEISESIEGYIGLEFLGTGANASILALDAATNAVVVIDFVDDEPVITQLTTASLSISNSAEYDAMLASGYFRTYDNNTGLSSLWAKSTSGSWVQTELAVTDATIYGQVRPGTILSAAQAGFFVHLAQPNGTFSTLEIDLGAYSFSDGYPPDVGEFAPDGTFTAWLENDGGDIVSVVVHAEPSSATGYALRNLGLLATDSYEAAGNYLGNGCWTFPENVYGWGSYGVDPEGGNGMRLWGCPVEGESEELASWEVAYRGDVTPTIGYRTIIERQCQNQIANTAEISTSTPEVTASNNTSTATTSVANADIAVSVTTPALVVDAASVSSIDLTITVTNNGPHAGKGVAAGLVLPAGLTTSAPLAWNIADLAVGASQTFVVPVAFVSTAADITYNVAASSTSASIDCNTDNDALTLSILSGDHPDIRVTKTGPASVRAFETFSYDVSWQNVGNVDATDFTVTDYLPPTSPELVVVDYGDGYLDTGVVNWDVVTLAIGETVTDQIVVEVDSCDLVGRTLVNTLTAPYVDDANPLDNEAAASTLVLPPAAALSVELVSNRVAVVAGEPVQLTAYYRNTGTATVIDGELGFDVSDWNIETSSVIGGYVAGGDVIYSLGNIPPGGYGSVTFAITGPGPGADTFSVTASGSNACPVSASVGASLKGTAIGVVKSASSDNACTGESVTWTIVVANPGDGPVNGVSVSDTIAAGATYVAGSISGPGASVSGATLTWAIGSIPAHGSVVLSYATTLDLVDATYVSNNPAWETDATTGVGNNTAVRVECDNALEVDKAMTITCVEGEPVVSVTLTYSNTGLTPIEDLVVSDYIGGLQAIGSDPAAVDGVVTFDRALLPAGASGTFTFSATLAAEAGQIVTNRATIEAAGDVALTSNQVAVAVPECVQAECDDNEDCADDDQCTTNICDNGTCTSTSVTCNDGSACTDDSCNSQTGCVTTPVVCNDGQACTTDSCDDATGCVYTPKVCDDLDACTNDACDPGTGECTTTAIDCGDGNLCTADSCDEGACVNVLNACDDGNPCTSDSCNTATGACVNAPVVCNDNSVCTADSCDQATGQCEFEALPCAPGDACHTAACDPVEGCVETAITCNDNSLCTNDSCHPALGCQFADISCNDGDACTDVVGCDAGTGCLTVATDCDDNNACTVDSCDSDTGCVNTPIVCNDGDACTTDLCDTQLGCQVEPVVCNDDDACTDNTCDPGTGCEYPTITCDDASACTTDTCDPVTGCSFDDIVCDDDNACTDDFCDTTLGCQTTAVDCEDGNACTTDQCDALIGCQYPIVTCNDGNACTVDSCDPVDGCSNVAADCDDNNACTVDTCTDDGGCVNTALACDDDDICTTDSCDPVLGCQNVAVDPRPFTCGAGACNGVVEGVESCIDNAWVNNCDELPTGQIPDSGNCGELRVAYAIVNDSSGQPYGTIRCFQDVDNHVIGCETVSGSTTELRIYEAFFCGEE